MHRPISIESPHPRDKDEKDAIDAKDNGQRTQRTMDPRDRDEKDAIDAKDKGR